MVWKFVAAMPDRIYYFDSIILLFFELNNHFTLPLSSDESKRSDVFASPDRVICVIKFTKEPGKRLGEKTSLRSIKIISTLHKT